MSATFDLVSLKREFVKEVESQSIGELMPGFEAGGSFSESDFASYFARQKFNMHLPFNNEMVAAISTVLTDATLKSKFDAYLMAQTASGGKGKQRKPSGVPPKAAAEQTNPMHSQKKDASGSGAGAGSKPDKTSTPETPRQPEPAPRAQPKAPVPPPRAGEDVDNEELIDDEITLLAFDESDYIGWDPAVTRARCANWSPQDLNKAIVYYIQLSGAYSDKKLKKRKPVVKDLLTRLNISSSLGSGDQNTLTLARIAGAHPRMLMRVRKSLFDAGKPLKLIMSNHSTLWQDMALMPYAKALGCTWHEDFIKAHATLYSGKKDEKDVKKNVERALEIFNAISTPEQDILDEVLAIAEDGPV